VSLAPLRGTDCGVVARAASAGGASHFEDVGNGSEKLLAAFGARYLSHSKPCRCVLSVNRSTASDGNEKIRLTTTPWGEGLANLLGNSYTARTRKRHPKTQRCGKLIRIASSGARGFPESSEPPDCTRLQLHPRLHLPVR